MERHKRLAEARGEVLMGTQFSSRLKLSDCQRILDGIRAARASVIGLTKRGRAVVRDISSLPPSQVRKLGNATVGQVLTVADSHRFFGDFSQSTIFKEVLEWLKRLRNDAAYNGFQGIIREYGLEQVPNPVAELGRKLLQLTTATEEKNRDPFRVAASIAAKQTLAKALTRAVSTSPNDSPAKKLGRRLADLDLKSVVTQYTNSFIHEFLRSVIDRADSDRDKREVQEAIDLSEKTAEQISRRSVKRVIGEGKLADTPRIHEIVLEELRRLTEPIKKAMASK